MMVELWAVLALFFLLVAIIAWGLKLFNAARRWSQVITVVRVSALLALGATILLSVSARGWGSPPDPRQLVLALAWTTLAVYVVLSWRFRVDAASPVVDLVAAGLVLTAMLFVQSGGLVGTQPRCAIPIHVHWALFLLGTGGVLVAGSAGLMLALRAVLAWRKPDLACPRRSDSHLILKHASAFALVALGAQLAVSTWWGWRTLGTLASEDTLFGWVAITWLVTAMSLLARRTGRKWGPWTAGLAVTAAVVVLLGLLIATIPRHLL